MYSSYHTALDARGYTFKFPTLGLQEPAKADWVPLKVAIGTQEACAALLDDPSTPAPLRVPDGDYSVIEMEYEDRVWFLPILDPLYHSQEPEVFSLNVRRVPASTMPSGRKRPQVTIPIGMIFLSPPDKRLAFWPPMPTMHGASWESTKTFDICLSPSEMQCEPVAPATLEADCEDEESKDERVRAWSRWVAMSIDEVNEEWLREVYRDAQAKGLRSKSSNYDPQQQLVRLRAHAAPNYNVEWLDYAVCREEDCNVADDAEWKALSPHAYSADFVRCSVNLLRKECGRRLFRREDWPPRSGRASPTVQGGDSPMMQNIRSPTISVQGMEE